MLKLDYVFDNLLESLEAAESLARASIRQAETFMQNIERKAKDRKVIRYSTHELTKAVNYYFLVERSMDRLEIVLGTIAEFGENISRNQRDKLILKIRNIIGRIKTYDVQFSQESNIVAELEILIFKLDLGKRQKPKYNTRRVRWKISLFLKNLRTKSKNCFQRALMNYWRTADFGRHGSEK